MTTNSKLKPRAAERAPLYGTGDVVVGGVWMVFYAIAVIAALVVNSDAVTTAALNVAGMN